MSKKTIDALAAEAAETKEQQEQQAEVPVHEVTEQELEKIDLPGDIPEGEEKKRDPFRIADDGAADWAVRKIAEEKAEFDRLREIGEEQIQRIRDKVERAKHRYEQNTAFLTSLLGDYFQTVPHRCTKTTEKYALLSGTLTLKYGRVDAKPDDAKLIPYLRQIGREDLIKVKEEVAWGELKKLLTFAGDTAVLSETGEIVDGITVATKPDTFSVDV